MIAVPNFMLLWMRLAVTALDTNVFISMPSVALAAIASNLAGSVAPVDRSRSLAFGGSPHWTLNVETS
jgi:hypothetical protein